MQNESSPRKNIHSIINNIRQMASNISKDVSMAQQMTLPSPQPTQDQASQNRTSKYDLINAKQAKSSRLTLGSDSNVPDVQSSAELQQIAQGIQNAHIKVDEALRFMTDMKNKLETEPLSTGEKKTSIPATPNAASGALKVKSLVDQSKLSHTIQQMSLHNFSKTTEPPSLGALPLSLEDLKTSPKTTAIEAPYFNQPEAPYFNPFSKSVTNKPTETYTSIAQNNTVFSLSSIVPSNSNVANTIPSLNLSSNPSFIHLMKTQAERLSTKPNISPSYASTNIVNPSANLSAQQHILTGLKTVHPTVNTQPACDYNRLNQIIMGIKKRDGSMPAQPKLGHQQKGQSLNDLQFGSVNSLSLTTIQDQAREFGMLRPNTISHISKPPLSSNWFVPPKEGNFYQLPQENVSSHYSSHNSVYDKNNGFRPKLGASGYFEPAIQAANYIGNVYSQGTENQEDFEDGFRPRRLTFDDQRPNIKVVDSQKVTPYIREVKQKNQRQKSVGRQSHGREAPKRQKYYEDIATDEDSMVDAHCYDHHHHQQCQKRKVRRLRESCCNHVEDSFSSQSEEESLEESIEFQQPQARKTVTHRVTGSQEQICANCHCRKTFRENVVTHTHTNAGSGKVSGSMRRSRSRKQESNIESDGLDQSANTNETEVFESKLQNLRKNRSIDQNPIKRNMRRKTNVVSIQNNEVEGVQNNENQLTNDVKYPETEKYGQQKRISLESLRKKDDNQVEVKKHLTTEISTKRTHERQNTQGSLYDRDFVDQLAIQFPSDKAAKTRAVQKTEIMRSSNQKPKRALV